jgi:energy-coupling factor transporter ATP-binding protein EcfA2
MKNDKVPDMYFASLEIENIKCFGKKQVLDLRDSNGAVSSWTLILGDNGVGKTTLLKCLAWMIPVEAPKITGGKKSSKVEIKPLMDDFGDESQFERLIRVGEKVNSRIGASFTNGVEFGTVPAKDKIISFGINFSYYDKGIQKIEPEFTKLDTFNSPNLFAYSASRHMVVRNYDNSALKDPISNLFSESGDLYDAEQVLVNLEFASLKEKGKGRATMLLDKVKLILVDLLPDLDSPNSIIINSPIDDSGRKSETLVQLKTPYGKVSLYDLSLGYKTMLSWAVDLALRMLWRSPDKQNPLSEPAVVIVDEIDLHLHPKWQRIVRDYLTTHFPRTQFICTAHSPFMAQSSETENLCVLNRIEDEVHIDNTPSIVKGWRIGQVATSDLFNVPSERSPEIEASINARRNLLAKGKLTNAEKVELAKLDQELSKLPVFENVENQKLLEQLRLATELLKKK